MTPAQLLERLGFRSSELSTPVRDLSGGQQRRLQLLLVLLDEPNVLILDEPSNDLDTEMLTAMEDLLDSWPGTLLVVSHDRYLLERVTDQQYAILDGSLRHLPGGIDEYLKLRTGAGRCGCRFLPRPEVRSRSGLRSCQAPSCARWRRSSPPWSGAPRSSHSQADKKRAGLADLDQADFELLGSEMAKVAELEDEAAALEEKWLELSTRLECHQAPIRTRS